MNGYSSIKSYRATWEHATCFVFNSAASYRPSSRQLKHSPPFSIVFSLSLSGGCDEVPPLENVISQSLLFRKCLELACNAQTCKTCMKYVRTHMHPHSPHTHRDAACKSPSLPPHSHTHTARRCNRQQLAFPKLQ